MPSITVKENKRRARNGTRRDVFRRIHLGIYRDLEGKAAIESRLLCPALLEWHSVPD